MGHDETRRLKQERLLDLASAYKGLNRRQLAEALGRDQTRLFPPSGNPKLDYLMRLADVLDWPVGDVAEAIWEDDRGAAAHIDPAATFEDLNTAARDAHRTGQFEHMCRLARRMHEIAQTAEQRATACHRESGGWDGLGRYTRELESIRRGLAESPIPADLRLLLRVNLSNTYHTLWQPLEARAMARDVIEELADEPPTTRPARAAQAFAFFVLGGSTLRLIQQDPAVSARRARAAREALETSRRLYSGLAEEFNNDPWRGIANTCRAGILECDVVLGEREPLAAVSELAQGVAAVPDSGDSLLGDRLESFGWWCIAGCTIALRHLSGRDLQKHMSTFTTRGYDIAARLGNWAMHERLFTLEYQRRQQLNELAGFNVEWTIAHDDVRKLVGTMGRFPAFRTTGWKILQTATVVRDN